MTSMRRTWLSSLLLAGAWGCAGAQHPPATSSQDPSPSVSACARRARDHQLEVSLSVEDGSARKPLCPGERLRTEDALVVAVESATDAYMRLVFVSADGRVSEWLPQQAEDMTRRASFRSPAGSLGQASDAQLFLVASLAPLSETDPVMHDMLAVIREAGEQAADAPPQPTAELHVESSADLAADFDEHGLVMLAIDLHAAR